MKQDLQEQEATDFKKQFTIAKDKNLQKKLSKEKKTTKDTR